MDPKEKERRLQALTPEQYTVTQEEGTERPFSNEFCDNKEPGLYVDLVSGEPLFSSTHKFDSGTGWPSFFETIKPDNVVRRVDKRLFRTRTEVRSKDADSHLGHVFDDGPEPTGLRYCINSAALRFVPVHRLEAEGYGEFLPLFARAGVQGTLKAVFAAGCFWGVEAAFAEAPGVLATTVGYTGGRLKDPDYRTVCSGETGHAEAVEVEFDPYATSYDKLLELFFELHDPTTLDRQGPDVGSQYRSAVFYHGDDLKRAAEAAVKRLDASGKFRSKIVTQIAPASEFYRAEEYHQKYFEKNGGGGCRR